MTHTLNIDRNIEPENVLSKYTSSPVGWWNVSTGGVVDVPLGTYYGHVAEIALCLRRQTGAFRFVKSDLMRPVPKKGEPRKIRVTGADISFDACDIRFDSWGRVQDIRSLAEWLDCEEILVSRGKVENTYTITLKKQETGPAWERNGPSWSQH